MNSPTNFSAKLAARRALTVWLSAAVPVALAAAETLKENLPALGYLLSGWRLIVASVSFLAVVAALRVRSAKARDA